MPNAVLGPAPAGRFPRWGYLDRLETNENMPRAGVAALILVSAVVLALLVARSFVADLPEPKHVGSIVHVGDGSMSPLPPPSIVPRFGGPKALATEPEVVAPIPVPDPVAEEQTLPGPQGSPGTEHGGWRALGPGDGDGPFDTVLEPAAEPLPDAFVPVEHMPELVHMHAPVYPDLARAAGIEGTVLVRVLVGEDGFVKKSILLQSVLALDEAALDASATAVFRPARQQERPVAVWVVIPIEFRLRP